MPKTKKKKTSPAKTNGQTPNGHSEDNAKPFEFDFNLNSETFKKSVLSHLTKTLARDLESATKLDWWTALCLTTRDHIMERYIDTMHAHRKHDTRRVYYLSLEYLMGRLLSNNLHNLGLYETAKKAMEALNIELDELCEEEPDMGLGNGGLGRLAACFLDSLATLQLPAIGYGIHYEFGLFRQEFVNGRQVEHPDNWLKHTNPWEVLRPQYTHEVPLYGRVENQFNDRGECTPQWVDTKSVLGVPWDVPICAYGADTVNFLRLWESRVSQELDLEIFNRGGYVEAVKEKVEGETISKVLYPNDTTENGKELRLVQQYFFVSCSIQDIIRRFKKQNDDWENFPKKVAIALNDTHPAVAILELMRLLMDTEGLDWDYSWSICRKCFSYTNHTLLPEALEKWSVPLFEKLLPRHLQIVFEINRRFLEEEVEKFWPGDNEKKRILSIIEEGAPKMIRMAYLSVIASHSVNGVAALHTALLKENLFPEFDQLYPNKFNNKTNGITPRRWLKACNPGLSKLIDESIGTSWPSNLNELTKLEKFADDTAFQEKFMQVKQQNKEKLAGVIQNLCGIKVDTAAIFDVQIKRLHEYKRQHLNLLHILTLYRKLLQNPDYDIQPRVFIFGAKAAPGYTLAKTIIHAINAVGKHINNDERIKDKLKIAFLPNYSVSLAELIIPAADLSEQISTAGKEASGTGNMKLALNGALTIGTLDGANVEILEEVGDENIFIFGLTVEQVEALRARGYNPYDYYYANEELRAVVDWVGSNYFTQEDTYALASIRDSLLEGGDPYLLLPDYEAYCQAQNQVDQAFRDKSSWAKKAILNTARVGKFSSDRTISQYANEIWKLEPLPVGPLNPQCLTTSLS